MAQWEYLVIRFSWEKLRDKKTRKEYWNWVSHFSDHDDIEGQGPILNFFGDAGWELVSIVPAEMKATEFVGYAHVTRMLYDAYLATFKRQKQ